MSGKADNNLEVAWESLRRLLASEQEAIRREWRRSLDRLPQKPSEAVTDRIWNQLCELVEDTPAVPCYGEVSAAVDGFLALLALERVLRRHINTQQPDLRVALDALLALLAERTAPQANVLDPFQLTPVVDRILDLVDIGHFCLDHEGRVVFWGKAMQRLYQVEEHEVLGRKLEEAFPAFKDEPEFQDLFRIALRKGELQQATRLRHRSKRKGIRYLNVIVDPLRDASERLVGLRALIHDVTEKRQSEKALNRYRQYVQTILQDAADAIIVLDEKDRIVMWNRGAEVLYGWKAEEVIGKPVTVIVPNDPRSQREIEWINQEVQKRGFIRDWEAQRITRDGRKVLINLTRTAIYDPDGKFVGSSVIARDVTEQRRLEQQLIQSEKLSAVGQLAAGIAHEIGSPLTAVSSLTQLLIERSDDQFFRERLTLIRKEVDRIARIVHELVDFSRPVTQKLERLNPNQIVEEAARIVRYDRRLRHKQVLTRLDPQVPPIEVGFDQMLQVLVNLLLNAADAIEHVHEGQVWIETGRSGDEVIISVRDNGIGIPPENLPHIFDPFFTTKKPGKGTGLGLWVCFNVVRSFNGRIEVDSEPGKGTEFRILLPCCTTPTKQTASRETA